MCASRHAFFSAPTDDSRTFLLCGRYRLLFARSPLASSSVLQVGLFHQSRDVSRVIDQKNDETQKRNGEEETRREEE